MHKSAPLTTPNSSVAQSGQQWSEGLVVNGQI